MRHLHTFAIAALLGALLSAGAAQARSADTLHPAALRAAAAPDAITDLVPASSSRPARCAEQDLLASPTDKGYCVRSCSPEYGCEIKCWHLVW